MIETIGKLTICNDLQLWNVLFPIFIQFGKSTDVIPVLWNA